MTDSVLPSLTQLLKACYGELRVLARRKTGSASAAEDIVQEACLRLTAADGAAIANPRAYLFRIVGNLAVDHRRRETTRNRYIGFDALPEEHSDGLPSAEHQIIDRERLALLARAVAELPPRCKQCFVMRRFENLSQIEIAHRLGISVSMVEKHLRHAAVYCARRLKELE